MAEEKTDKAERVERADQENRPEEYVKRDDVDRLIQNALRERDEQNAQALNEARAAYPSGLVPAHAGGPGVGHHQRSWSLAEQEAASRGETLDHWE